METWKIINGKISQNWSMKNIKNIRLENVRKIGAMKTWKIENGKIPGKISSMETWKKGMEKYQENWKYGKYLK